MALNLGDHFTQRWTTAPLDVRQTYLDDLSRICELLEDTSNLNEWQNADQQQQLKNKKIIEASYAQLKAKLIEDEHLRQRKVFENILAEQRASEQEFKTQLEQEVQQQEQHEKAFLQQFKQQLEQQTSEYVERYTPVSFNQPSTSENQPISNTVLEHVLENMQVRLELEAESLIEHVQKSMQNFNDSLQQATQEEIEIALAQQKKT